MESSGKSNLKDTKLDIEDFLDQVNNSCNNIKFLLKNKENYISRKEIRHLRLSILKKMKEENPNMKKQCLRWSDDRDSIDSYIRKFLKINKKELSNCYFKFGFKQNDDQIDKIYCCSKELDIRSHLDIGIPIRCDKETFFKGIELKSISSFLERSKKIEKVTTYYHKFNALMGYRIKASDFVAKINDGFQMEFKINLGEKELESFLKE